MLGGYANRIAHIDLTKGTVEYSPMPEEWARKYVGARGLGVRYLLENGPQVDPLSPANMLCFMNGPLTGTNATMSGRQAVVTKSPLTGTVTDSHIGGWSAARQRWAGFDGLIFTGKAETPVYAYVQDGVVELRDATDLWGKGIHETIRILKERYGEKDLSVTAIGQAGENLVRFAAWVNENDRAAGRGGTGAVGGSKNLKAIVVKAVKKLPKAVDQEAWKPAHKQALATIMDEKNITSPRKGGLSVYGTNMLMNVTNTMGALPTRNSQTTSFGEQAELISGEYVNEHILVENPTCHACPVACKKEVEIKEGPFAGLRMESVEYEPAWALGANCGNDDINTVAKIIDMSNDYGFDAIEIGNVLSMYMELSEKNYLNGHPTLEWGDAMSMVTFTEHMVAREGVGDILAEGTTLAAKAFGHLELAMAVKGQSVPAYDPRGLKGMGIGYATSNRGACHLRSYTPASELGVVTPSTDPLAWKGKGELAKIFQDLHAFSDSLDLCKFSAFAEGADEYAAQYAAMTGMSYSPEDVLTTGERIYNLERYYNNLAGFGEGSDYLPDRFVNEPSTMPGSEGHVCELDLMLEEYYAARGWHNGVVPEEKLQSLGVV
ncbi:MAG: aldehyde ferredoxin oxidoreductase [Chloroflexi bacterium AL-W]|nr:aldehyde ferredoxin oxidoreductase [Chloroflexi bacterium AL-N1]NOK69557.1 aldehyde ferredoxin oxidoreductase [Chloroflexi bacterium AL-N10]NOK77522.1 aldehyde ferredoxin oxidoreductase [Chloroflexi bacterium AL-N5]NOK84373.1 aldehyde ferredoxin oxidoreductase [Chloroflexi bacterium AL-W]NOK91461.1 aldehyde ferredoxin oxidoreductase [Chloroflexi bacterium AL-N15]